MDFNSEAEDKAPSPQPDERTGFVEPDLTVSEKAREVQEVQVFTQTVESEPVVEIRTPSPLPVMTAAAVNVPSENSHDNHVVSLVTMETLVATGRRGFEDTSCSTRVFTNLRNCTAI